MIITNKHYLLGNRDTTTTTKLKLIECGESKCH